MWKNIVETNIMVRITIVFSLPKKKEIQFPSLKMQKVGTHADSLIAEAVLKNITGFDRDLAWEAVWKDVITPPVDDSIAMQVQFLCSLHFSLLI